jgi:hypothetical protein
MRCNRHGWHHPGMNFDKQSTMDDPDEIRDLRANAFARMSPAQKLRMVEELYVTGIQLRTAGLLMQHPDWTREQAEFEARRSLLYSGT